MLSPEQLRRNAFFHILDGIFFFAALALFSREVIMPKMIADLSESALLVGLVPLIYWTGYVLPQMLYAKSVEGVPHKKPAVLGCAVLQRIGLLVYLLLMPALWGGPAVLVVFFCMLGVNSLGSGLIMPVWSDWYAKTTAEGQWARLLGLRMAVFGILAGPHRRPSYSAVYFSLLGISYALCPVLAGALLDRGVVTFAGMFALSGALALVGWLVFALMHPPSPAA